MAPKQRLSLRRAFWHLRKGGMHQLRAYTRRIEATRNAESHRNKVLPTELVRPRRLGGTLLSSDEVARPNLTVGVILDEFSTYSYQYEWNQLQIPRQNWQTFLQHNKIDLLFIESAWNGNAAEWKFTQVRQGGPHSDLVGLVQHCKDQGIPTVFWNKEDPIHFQDFIQTAKLFDFVFTTDINLIPKYKSILKHNNVDALPFAAQPRLSNPSLGLPEGERKDIAFGGMYFNHRHEDRRRQMDLILGAAAELASSKNVIFDIYSRYHDGDERYQFPPSLQKYVRGSLGFDKMAKAYGEYRIFLNVNTVTSSNSMCARRIFEITASGTTVLSTASPAIDTFFPDKSIIQVHDQVDARQKLALLLRDPELRRVKLHQAQRTIWTEHTYSHRVSKVLDAVGVNDELSQTIKLSAIAPTNRPEFMEKIIENLRRQDTHGTIDIELIIGTHGFTVPYDSQIRLKESLQGVNVKFIDVHPDLSLGAMLNYLITFSNGDIIAKIDDDDYYGPFYLLDQVNALKYSRADIVGKACHYVYSGELQVMKLLRRETENRYTHFVSGPTLMFWRKVADRIPFQDRTTGEDTGFLKDAANSGCVIYATDRFNFIQVRRGKNESLNSHTWKIDEWQIISNSTDHLNGWNPQHISI